MTGFVVMCIIVFIGKVIVDYNGEKRKEEATDRLHKERREAYWDRRAIRETQKAERKLQQRVIAEQIKLARY